MDNLPLGALRKAQRALAHTKAANYPEGDISSSEDESEAESGARSLNMKGKQKEIPEWSTKPRTDLAKRSSKHA